MFDNYFELDSLLSLLKKAGFWSGFDEKAVGGLNGLLNLLFGIGKLIVQAGNTLIDKVYSVDVLNKYIDSAFSSGKNVWDTVFSTFGVVFLTLLFVYGIRDFMKVGLHKMYLRLLTFSVLAILAIGFFSQGSQILKEVNTISSNAQNTLVTKMSPNYSSGGEKIAKDLGLKQPSEPTKKVENMMYYKFVMEPFALMNFGKTSISASQYKDYSAGKGKFNDKRDDEIKNKVNAEAKKNAYLTGKKLGDKYAVLLNTGIDYLIVAGIVLLISVLNFLTQIFILAMVLIAPIWLVLALLPDNEHVLANGMKLLFGAFGVKIALGVGFGFTFMILGWIDSAFALSSVIEVMASLIVKVILTLLVVKNFASFRRLLMHGELDNGLKRGIQETAWQNFLPNFNSSIPSLSTAEFSPDGEFDSAFKTVSPTNDLYGENVQLTSALEGSETPNFGENLLKKAGYMNERGLVKSAKDKASDAFHHYYDDSLAENAITETGQLIGNPVDYMKGKAAPYMDAFQEGQFNALEREVVASDFHTRDYAHERQDTEEIRYALEEEKNEKKITVSPRNDDAYIQRFYTELAQLRGESFMTYQDELTRKYENNWPVQRGNRNDQLTSENENGSSEPKLDPVSTDQVPQELEEATGGDEE
ncbi:CD3337/EF1877 family mobilome membrane protein [Enterococcus sp. AZ196]|uniref:CD3337/EF1877 family mobilome membrane protein n=1 Tax=Enterococcus sp. AZ196 TaxID=2774659 RepID=UPI003D2A68B6